MTDKWKVKLKSGESVDGRFAQAELAMISRLARDFPESALELKALAENESAKPSYDLVQILDEHMLIGKDGAPTKLSKLLAKNSVTGVSGSTTLVSVIDPFDRDDQATAKILSAMEERFAANLRRHIRPRNNFPYFP